MTTSVPDDSAPPSAGDWDLVVELIEGVLADARLLGDLVAEVRSSIHEISGLEPADVARHTRGLLSAATRAVAERRGPTPSELTFVDDLAVARARQGIPAHAVLSSIHVAERRIWASARSLARSRGIPADVVLEARGLYDDWAALVRERLIVSHTAASRSALGDRDTDLLRRLLAGGSAAALAARSAALVTETDPHPTLLVAAAPDLAPDAAGLVLSRLRSLSPGLSLGPAGMEDGDVVAVWRRLPSQPDLTVAVGVSAPTAPEALPAARAQAVTAARAARRRGLVGLVPTAAVATLSALQDRGDLATLLLQAHREALDALPRREAALHTVRTWLESGRNTDRTAARLFVHPNTVRNRVRVVTEALRLDPDDPFEGVDLWWLCAAAGERRDTEVGGG